MGKISKWIVAIIAALFLLVVIAILIAPHIIDVDKYRPKIESEVAKATGRSFQLGGPLKPSVFPWIGIALSDVHLGNPEGFSEKDFVSVQSFEVRVKLLPLLFRKVEVKRFIVSGPRIVLETNKDGRTSWSGIGTAEPGATAPPAGAESSDGFALKDLQVSEFAINNGELVWVDHRTDTRKAITDMNVTLSDVSLDKPIGVLFTAVADNKPLSLDGKLGPLGAKPGKTPLPVELAVKLADLLAIQIKGKVDAGSGTPTFDLGLNIDPFSPRKLMAALELPLPIEPADSRVLDALAVALKLSGSPQSIVVSDGQITLDDTRITLSAQAREFDKPNLTLDMGIDSIDLDRYLPAPSEKTESTGKEGQTKTAKTDYGPLRRLEMEARIKAGEMKVKNARMQNVEMTAKAKNGIIHLDPLTLDLYQGRISGKTALNVQKDTPRTAIDLALNRIHVGPMIKDLLSKDLIEGNLSAAIGLKFTGDQPDLIRKTLNGNGDLKFNDGAIVGVDLANMVRNVQTAFSGAEKPTEKPRTDFTELAVPFTIRNGLLKTEGSNMQSPLLRLLAAGKADLAKETIDFRLEPKFVATIVGQGDSAQRKGLTVPVLISGNFSNPKFAPDLKGLLDQRLGKQLPDKEALKEKLPKKEEVKKELEDKANDLLKGLPFGN